MAESATLLEVSPCVIRRLLKQGILPGHQTISSAPWIIKRQDLELPDVRKAIQEVREGRLGPQSQSEETEMPLFTGEL